MELSISLVLTILIFVATAISIPPFSTVMDFGEKMKNSWEESSQEPFIPHAEDMSLEELTQQIGISQEEALILLKNKGIKAPNMNSKVKDIAKDNNTSPVAIYEALQKEPSPKKKSGQGYGRKTLENIAQELGIPVQDIMAFLKSEGINARKDEVIRTIAEKNGITPYELVEIIQKLKE
jgi:hypothetical protein